MTRRKRLKYPEWFVYILSFVWMLYPTASAQMQSGYAQWKIRQEQHDIRLKQQTSAKPIQQRIVQVEPAQPLLMTHNMQQSSYLGESITVNVNAASVQELTAKLEGIGQKKAQAIIDYRQQHGTFKKTQDLLNVKGIGAKTLEKNKERIRLN